IEMVLGIALSVHGCNRCAESVGGARISCRAVYATVEKKALYRSAQRSNSIAHEEETKKASLTLRITNSCDSGTTRVPARTESSYRWLLPSPSPAPCRARSGTSERV